MAENNAYKLKLFQDEPRACAPVRKRVISPTTAWEKSACGTRSSVFISIKPGTFYIADPSEYDGKIAVTTLDGHHGDAAQRAPGLTSGRVQGPPGRTRHSPHLSRVVLPVLRARASTSTCWPSRLKLECVTAEPSMGRSLFRRGHPSSETGKIRPAPQFRLPRGGRQYGQRLQLSRLDGIRHPQDHTGLHDRRASHNRLSAVCA